VTKTILSNNIFTLFRLFVISRLEKLKYLDDRKIDTDEEKEAHRMYPR
jgi:hypothetical protein